MFTPVNSSGFSYSCQFIEPPHALRVSFTNPEASDQADTCVVYWGGYNADGSGGLTAATKLETLDAKMTVSPDDAWRLGGYHLAVKHLRPTLYSWTADIESMVCERGDLMSCAYDSDPNPDDISTAPITVSGNGLLSIWCGDNRGVSATSYEQSPGNVINFGISQNEDTGFSGEYVFQVAFPPRLSAQTSAATRRPEDKNGL